MARRLHGRPDKSDLGTEGVSGWHPPIDITPRREAMLPWWTSVLEHALVVLAVGSGCDAGISDNEDRNYAQDGSQG
jgi:hypothetical protein